jgi:multicomponent Na+:H+ antiporter subunit G
MSTWELITFTLAAVGVAFMFVSGIGIVRLPDVYTRMHAAGKATTLGISCILLAAGLYYGTGEMVRMVIFIILFFITGPIATTAMSRAAYRTDAKRSLVLHYDELAAAEDRDRLNRVDRRSLP